MKREESQNVEYKESWHDRYLEWVCGYANAKGGTLYIGIEDGTKKPVGVKNPNKLMEDLPDMFERLDLMERKGSGFKKLYEDYEKLSVNLGKRMPSLESESDYFRVTLPNLLYGFTDEELVAAVDNSVYGVAMDVAQTSKTHHDTPPVTPPVAPPVTYHDTYHDAYHDACHEEQALKPNEIRLLKVLASRDELGAADLRKAIDIKYSSDLRERCLRPLYRAGYIGFTLPNAKRSRLQKYRITAKGHEYLAGLESQ